MITPRLVLILGMHRSGTSCLAGALEQCGLYLGDVWRINKFNAKGYFERPDLVKIHNQILGLNRAAWHRPQPMQVQIHPFHRQKLTEIARSLMTAKAPGGLKDPRTLLLLEQWEKFAPDSYALVGTFRHPLAVARSLSNRDKLRESHAFDLWVHYNTILVTRHKRQPFPLIEYDLRNKSRYLQNVVHIATHLNLLPNLRKLNRFIDPKLMHHHFNIEQLPAACRPIYEYLRHHCGVT